MLALEQLEKGSYFGLIYKITNKINNKIYIGQTKNLLSKRLNGHRHKCNPHLSAAFKKYGFENFSFEIVCYTFHTDQEFLDMTERVFIVYYNSDNKEFGYNKTSGGNSNFKQCYTQSEKMKAYLDRAAKESKFYFNNLTEQEKIKLKIINRDPEKRKRISETLKKNYASLTQIEYEQRFSINKENLDKVRHIAYNNSKIKHCEKQKNDIALLDSISYDILKSIRLQTKKLKIMHKAIVEQFGHITYKNFIKYMRKNGLAKRIYEL